MEILGRNRYVSFRFGTYSRPSSQRAGHLEEGGYVQRRQRFHMGGKSSLDMGVACYDLRGESRKHLLG